MLIRQVVVEVNRIGLDGNGLCRGLGFGLSDLNEPEFLVSYGQTCEVLRRAMPLFGRPNPGLALGAEINVVTWGACLLALMAAPDTHRMLELAVRHLPSSWPFLRLDLQHGPPQLSVFAEDAFGASDISGFLVEHTFASLCRVGRFIVAPSYRPLAVEFVMPKPQGAVAQFTHVFGCPVRFQQPSNRLVYPARAVSIGTADEAVARLCDQLLVPRQAAQGVKSQVEQVIVRALRRNLKSPPSMRLIADSIHLSERTLRRRLDAAGLTYASLLDDERRRATLTQMQEGGLPLSRIAQSCGFADVRSLRRALKRWTGLTPSEVRRVHA